MLMTSILVVDDERSMRDFLKILLEKDGHHVTTAESAFLALDILKQQEVDVVVSDIRMPGMTGIELLENIKEDSPELPVILITAFASPDDAVLAMKNGAFDYITKPFNVDELKSVIESANTEAVNLAQKEIEMSISAKSELQEQLKMETAEENTKILATMQELIVAI